MRVGGAEAGARAGVAGPVRRAGCPAARGEGEREGRKGEGGKENGKRKKKKEKRKKKKEKEKERERERGIDGENHGGDRDGRSRVGDRQPSGAGLDGGEEKEGGLRSAEREEKME